MAREVRLVVTCDGEPGTSCGRDVTEDKPVRFTWAGKNYVRDLCHVHRETFAMLMDELVKASSPDVPTPKVPRATTGRATSTNGKPLGRPRGPMPKSVCRYCQKPVASITLVKHTKRFHPDLSVHSMAEVEQQVEREKVGT